MARERNETEERKPKTLRELFELVFNERWDSLSDEIQNLSDGPKARLTYSIWQFIDRTRKESEERIAEAKEQGRREERERITAVIIRRYEFLDLKEFRRRISEGA